MGQLVVRATQKQLPRRIRPLRSLLPFKSLIIVPPVPITASAPTRIDLAGGTLDLWPIYLFYPQALTINVTINAYATVRIAARTDRAYVLRSQDQNQQWQGKSFDSLQRGRALPLLRAVLIHSLKQARDGGRPPLEGGLSIETDCAAPAGSGLGGSSALNIALHTALNRFLDLRLARSQIIQQAQNLETTIIEAPTGWQDYYSAVYGGLQALWGTIEGVKREELTVDLQELQAHLLLCYCGQSRLSALTNWNIFRAFFDGNPAVQRCFRAIAESALGLYDVLQSGRLERLAKPIAAEWSARQQLARGVSTTDIERIGRAARQAGASAMNVCGAGGGGCLFFVTPARKRRAVSDAIQNAGAQVLEARLVKRGVRCKTAI